MEVLKKISNVLGLDNEIKVRTNLEKIGQEIDKTVFRKAVHDVLYVVNNGCSFFDVEGIGPSVHMSDGLYIPSTEIHILRENYNVSGYDEAYFPVQKLLLTGIFRRKDRKKYLEKWLDESSDAKV